MNKIDHLFKTISDDLALQVGDDLDVSTHRRKSDFTLSEAEALDSLPRTDMTAAKALRLAYGAHVSFIEPENTWYCWNGRVHEPIGSDAIAHRMVSELWEDLSRNIKTIETQWKNSGIPADKIKEFRTLWTKHRAYRDRLASSAGQSSLIQMLKMTLKRDDDYFLDDRRWFVVRNGVFDMEAVRQNRTFELLPHDSTRPVYRMFDVDDAPGATAPALQKFLSESIEDDTQARFLSKAISLALLGAPHKTKTVVSIQGKTNSGKSMILDCLDRLSGDTGLFAAPSESAITQHGRNKEHARYPMRNARVIAFSEVRQKLDQTFILKYSGGDPFAVEEKYIAGSTVKPQGIIFVANNTPLEVNKSDEAMLKRIATINFPYTFSKVDPDHYEDETLGDRIVSESSGFLEWLKASYLAFLDEGLDRSESMEKTIREEAEESDIVNEYLQVRTITGLYRYELDKAAIQSVMFTDFYRNFVEYCREQGFQQGAFPSKREVKNALLAQGFELTKASVLRVKGLILNSEIKYLP